MYERRRARTLALALAAVGLAVAAAAPPRARAEEDWQRQMQEMRAQIEELRRRDEESRRKIEGLRTEVERLRGAVDAAGDTAPPAADTSARTAPAAAPADSRAARDAALDAAVTRAGGTPSAAAGEAPSEDDALDRAVAQAERDATTAGTTGGGSDVWSRTIGGSRVRLIDVSADLLAAAGGSTEDDDALQDLQGGAHDPRKNGFTLQQLELALAAAVDPFFRAETYVVYALDPLDGESTVELEEAFATTTALPWGLEIEAGHFFTEVGRINPRHPHEWDWQDQPVINSRLFGGDGMRAPGARVGWLTPLPWYSELHYGVQNANGETMVSFLANDEVFEERAIGGRPFADRDVDGIDDLVHLARWDNSWDPGPQTAIKIGASSLWGPNSTGDDADTWIYGADVVAKWRGARARRGWPFLTLQAEYLRRDYDAAATVLEGDPDDPGDDVAVGGETLHDHGVYAQALYGFRHGWAAGLRADWADGSGPNLEEDGTVTGRAADAYRDRRWRLSPLVAWYPSEFSRLRLQYNYDDARHLDEGHAHSVWLGLEVLYGAHPAHKF